MSYGCSSLFAYVSVCVVVLLLVGVSGFIGVCVSLMFLVFLSLVFFLCVVGFCSPGCLCVLGFCVLGLVFGVLGGCLWGVFFIFWRMSGVLFCWGGGFWGGFFVW